MNHRHRLTALAAAALVGAACGSPSSSATASGAVATSGSSGKPEASTNGLGITGGASSVSSVAGNTSSAAATSSGPGTASSTTGGGTGSPGPNGSPCSRDSNCLSAICQAVDPGSSQGICVSACTGQEGCDADAGLFCDPQRTGSPNGLCVPSSPAHCLACTVTKDCGWLSEVCAQVEGDEAPSCHIDCSLGGSSACPADYDCRSEAFSDGGGTLLCVPLSGDCSTAEGGACGRVTGPQSCTVANDAGSCDGQRVCDPDAGRFTACDAPTPECLTSCDAGAPEGCRESICPGVAEHCGACANCPGSNFNSTTANAGCDATLQCGFSCKGENYDVDDKSSDGCEKVDAPLGNHVQSTATNFAPSGLGCSDSSSTFSLNGVFVSDPRAHQSPSVAGFDPASGSAPDWFTVVGTGGTFCEDDLSLNLQIYGSTFPTCYTITFTTSSNTSFACSTSSSGACSISQGSGTYNDGDTLYWEITKTCPSSQSEYVTYNVSGHL